jgi:hypothetical protein
VHRAVERVDGVHVQLRGGAHGNSRRGVIGRVERRESGAVPLHPGSCLTDVSGASRGEVHAIRCRQRCVHCPLFVLLRYRVNTNIVVVVVIVASTQGVMSGARPVIVI